ncbi:MAG TPA: family 1 glycosylhydrolase [Flavobacterium sp.]|jgi:dTDP-4-dehydrorhamnose reductase
MKQLHQKPEIWAGIECTINRLKSGYKDQLEYNGHYTREGDLEAIADLGIKTLRYPVLWEKHQPQKNQKIDFSWISKNLNKLREHGIKPIAGLVHHGSGPEYTNLLDPGFPELLAAYAKEVATKFPWLEMYTPVNEPLTTARFSGLYGHWYPHEKNDVSFVKMLLIELKATVLAMQEIRKINPKALLVQTEDLGKTYSTPLLHYQAKMENERRYLTFDILCGQFTVEHPMYDHFMHLGIDPSELAFFVDHPCPPDLIGVNYYCTSERYLDEDLSKYPESRHGGNTLHEYADVEAIRVRFDEPHGFKVLMRELWERYNLPIAVTEAHLHCSREGQMKWFLEIYESACELKSEGMDVRSVTAWSVLGSYGWNKLLTSDEMEYERGTFDVSSGKRRPTAMSAVLKNLVEKGEFKSPLLHGVAWWKSESRYFPLQEADHDHEFPELSKPILIIGKTGTLGKAMARVCKSRCLHYVLLGRNELDICDMSQIEAAIQQHKPWAIINTAGYVRVDDAENEPEKCFRENNEGAKALAVICKQHDIQLLTFSSDLVFDGSKKRPYVESDPVNPLNIYGESKAKAESAVLEVYPQSLVIRTSAFFGPWDEHNFVHHVMATLERGEIFEACDDVISPTYVPHLADAVLDILIDREHGIWHISNYDAISWYELAKEVARRSGFDPDMIKKTTLHQVAKRPAYSVLNSEKGILMPSLAIALDQYFASKLVLASAQNS